MRDALQNLEETTSSEHVFPRVTLNGLSERGNTPGLTATPAICGTTSLRVTLLALFYESVKRGTKTVRKSKSTTNWANEVKPQTRQKLRQFAPRMDGTLFLCLSLYIY